MPYQNYTKDTDLSHRKVLEHGMDLLLHLR